jgi:beta-lactamase regulating signal transducer with metallopeptidase domain
MMAELACRVSLILLLALFAVRWLPLKSAALRHLVLSLALLGSSSLPFTAAVLPELRLPLLPASRGGDTAVEGREANPRNEPASRQAATATVPAAPSSSRPGGEVPPEPLVILWVSVTLVFLGRLGWTQVQLAGLRRCGRRAPVSLRRESRELSRLHGVRRAIFLVETREIEVPATWGLLRPVLAVPPGFQSWETGRRRRVLAHELAHVQRFDAVWNLVAELATCLFWWNPLVWYAARSAREESEQAVDARVLAMGARPADYAGDLLAVARSLTGADPGWTRAVAGMGRGGLRLRIEAILAPQTPPLLQARTALATCILGAVLVGLTAAGLPVEARGSSPRASTSEPAGASTGLAAPPWPAHQLRWARGGEAAGLFLEGAVDLDALVQQGSLPGPGGFLVWFERDGAGGWKSLAATGREGGGQVTGRDGLIPDPERAMAALRASLARVAPDWREYPDTSIGALGWTPELRGRPRLDFSGSVILGVPGTSRDPDTGTLQAGWYEGGERIGVFTRGPLEIDPTGPTLVRLAEDGWLAAFGWTAATGRLRVIEVFPGAGGRPLLHYSEDGSPERLDREASTWLRRVLSRLPGSEPGQTLLSWRG